MQNYEKHQFKDIISHYFYQINVLDEEPSRLSESRFARLGLGFQPRPRIFGQPTQTSSSVMVA